MLFRSLLDLPQSVRERRMFGFFDDFEWFISPHRWTSLAADAGTSVASSATGTGGTVFLTTGAVDNNVSFAPGQTLPTPLPDFLGAADLSWQIDIWRQLRNARDAATFRFNRPHLLAAL